MKEHFRTASLIGMKLPAFLKERLWRSRLIENPAALHVLSTLSNSFIETKTEASCLTEEMIKTDLLIRQHSNEFFYYRKGIVPPECLYATAAKNSIAMAPELFPNLPEGYKALEVELEKLKSNPEAINDARVTPQAKFCHLIEVLKNLQDYNFSLRSGKLAAGDSEAGTLYKSIVEPAKLIKAGPSIINDILKLTQDIDFFFNHYQDEFAWYIETGIREKASIFNNDYLFDELEIPDAGRSRSVFNSVYDHSKQINSDSYSAYYDFCEKVLTPARMFITNFSNLSEESFIYALVKPAAASGFEFFEADPVLNDNEAEDSLFTEFQGLRISKEVANVYECAETLSSLVYHTLRMWGSTHQPFVFYSQVNELLEKLEATGNVDYHGLPMESYMQKYREMAADLYNNIAKKNQSLGFVNYSAPDLPPHP